MKKTIVKNSVIQFFLLMMVWLLMSGHYDTFHISMGILSSIGVVLFHVPVRKHYAHEEEKEEAKKGNVQQYTLRYGRLILFYIPWMVYQIYLASIQVASVVLNPKMPIDPAIVKFKTRLPNTSAKVILSNSITLTPGTITIDLKGDEFLVHSLMDASSGGIVDGSMPGEVAKLFMKNPEPMIQEYKYIRSGDEL